LSDIDLTQWGVRLTDNKPETPEQAYSRVALEIESRKIGKAIAHVMPEGVGFCFFMFNQGAGGGTTYLSNSNRDDAIKMLRDFLAKLSD